MGEKLKANQGKSSVSLQREENIHLHVPRKLIWTNHKMCAPCLPYYLSSSSPYLFFFFSLLLIIKSNFNMIAVVNVLMGDFNVFLSVKIRAIVK